MKTTKNRGLALLILAALTLTVTLGANGAEANAQEVLYVVHYAQRDLARTGLTDVGRGKAKALARMLIDAGIDVIYSTKTSWVVQTAEPTAKALNITINNHPSHEKAVDDLVRRLRTQHAKDRVFIAAALPTMQQILRGFGFTDLEVLSARKDTLFVIIPRSGSEPQVIKLRW
ncbi:MAG: histidine phosphatase family protein [Candidatus Binatia bacterium]